VNPVLVQFEKHTGLGATRAAKLLGVGYSTYAQIRNGRRRLQRYTRNHIQALTTLSSDALDRLIKEHVYGR
jgi:hypothetical protein